MSCDQIIIIFLLDFLIFGDTVFSIRIGQRPIWPLQMSKRTVKMSWSPTNLVKHNVIYGVNFQSSLTVQLDEAQLNISTNQTTAIRMSLVFHYDHTFYIWKARRWLVCWKYGPDVTQYGISLYVSIELKKMSTSIKF